MEWLVVTLLSAVILYKYCHSLGIFWSIWCWCIKQLRWLLLCFQYMTLFISFHIANVIYYFIWKRRRKHSIFRFACASKIEICLLSKQFAKVCDSVLENNRRIMWTAERHAKGSRICSSDMLCRHWQRWRGWNTNHSIHNSIICISFGASSL